MNRKLLCLSAFLLACLIGIGYVWRLEATGEAKFGSHSNVLTIDELIRGLIPDSTCSDEEWAIRSWTAFARPEDPVKWENRYNSQGEYLSVPRVGSVELTWNNRQVIPGDWDIILFRSDLFAISHDSIFDVQPGELPIQLQEGERADLLNPNPGVHLPFININSPHNLYFVQLKGKKPIELLIEWPCEVNGHFFGIYGKIKEKGKEIVEINERDDLFKMKELQKQEQPIFSEGDFKEWWRNYVYPSYYKGSGNFIIEKNGSVIQKQYYINHPFGVTWVLDDEEEKELDDLNKAAKHALNKMPKWKPGKIKRIAIRVYYEFN